MAKVEFRIGDDVKILSCTKIKHYFPIGVIGKIVDVDSYGNCKVNVTTMPTISNRKIPAEFTQTICSSDLKLSKKPNMNKMEKLVAETAKKLSKNGIFTTLEIKEELIKEEPQFYWRQQFVSDVMAKLPGYSYNDNGTFREYYETKSVPQSVKSIVAAVFAPSKVVPAKTANSKPRKGNSPVRVSKHKAQQIISGTPGFGRWDFLKQDGSLRTINGQIAKKEHQTDLSLGYIIVKEASKAKKDPKDCIRRVNIQTLKSFRVGGVEYKI